MSNSKSQRPVIFITEKDNLEFENQLNLWVDRGYHIQACGVNFRTNWSVLKLDESHPSHPKKDKEQNGV